MVKKITILSIILMLLFAACSQQETVTVTRVVTETIIETKVVSPTAPVAVIELVTNIPTDRPTEETVAPTTILPATTPTEVFFEAVEATVGNSTYAMPTKEISDGAMSHGYLPTGTQILLLARDPNRPDWIYGQAIADPTIHGWIPISRLVCGDANACEGIKLPVEAPEGLPERGEPTVMVNFGTMLTATPTLDLDVPRLTISFYPLTPNGNPNCTNHIASWPLFLERHNGVGPFRFYWESDRDHVEHEIMTSGDSVTFEVSSNGFDQVVTGKVVSSNDTKTFDLILTPGACTDWPTATPES